MQVNEKRQREQQLLGEMIALYCKKNHSAGGLCAQCASLKEYALLRSEKCPYMQTKVFCTNCKTHCYKPQMREKIRAVMCYSGPRLLFTHPILLLKHMYYSKEAKRGNV